MYFARRELMSFHVFLGSLLAELIPAKKKSRLVFLMSLLTSLRVFLYLDQITSLGFLSKRFFKESLSRN